MPMRILTRASRAPGRSARHVLLLSLVLAGAACDSVERLLVVQSPSILTDEQYFVPANASLIAQSAQADLECALGGYVVASGLAAGEFIDGSQTAARWSYDRRDVLPIDELYSATGCVGIGVYTPMSTARYTNDETVRRLDGWTDAQVPNRQQLIARASAFAGYSMVLLAEGFCSCAIDVGPELTSDQAFDAAISRFDRAITIATQLNDQAILNLALVGRARARLGRGNRAGAAEDAARVPVAFVFSGSADNLADRRQNRVFAQNNAGFAVTVAPAYRAMTVAGRPDPRVNVVDGGRNAGDQTNRLWVQNKFTSLTQGQPIASGIEAQLIVAEVRGGAQGIAILNALRARAGVALPALTAAEESDFAATVIEERRRELFLQGNRWFDMKRLSIPQVPAAGTAYSKGGVYGNQRCWPLPDVERLANPNLTG
jgi:starch-binding outer membrane protein, SusD/RagB family